MDVLWLLILIPLLFDSIDGCCRHVVATLFEVLDFVQDFKKTSCTSGPCMWVRRASQADQLGKPIPASQLETSIMVEPRYISFVFS